MNWLDLGAGAIIGLLLQNILFPVFRSRLSTFWRRRHFQVAQRVEQRIETRFPSIVLAQGGWGEDGVFARSSTVLELNGHFQIDDPHLAEICDRRKIQ